MRQLNISNRAGPNAIAAREEAGLALTRIAAGDESLIHEIRVNSLTDDPFTQLAREALSSYGASAVPATLQPASSVEPVLVQARL